MTTKKNQVKREEETEGRGLTDEEVEMPAVASNSPNVRRGARRRGMTMVEGGEEIRERKTLKTLKSSGIFTRYLISGCT